MNKKGIGFFMPFLTISILLLLTLAFIQLVQIDPSAEPIGMRQQAILETYQESQAQTLYAKGIIAESIEKTTNKATSIEDFETKLKTTLLEDLGKHPLSRINGELSIETSNTEVIVTIENNELPVLLHADLTTGAIPARPNSNTTTIIPGDTTYKETIQRLNTKDTITGKLLIELVYEIDTEEGLNDPALLIAMITAESKGIPYATSETQVCGLLQVTRPTANQYLKTSYSEVSESTPCTASARPWSAPERQIRAAARYLKDIKTHYDGPQQIRYAAAEYNGGGIVQVAFKRYGDDYTRAINSLSIQDFRDNGYPEKKEGKLTIWTNERLIGPRSDGKTKRKEIFDHGNIVARYYEMAGGYVPPTFVTTNRIGIYSYTIQVKQPYDAVRLSQAEDLIESLETCEGTACTQKIVSLQELFGPMTLCADQIQTYAELIRACSNESHVNLCACTFDLPDEGAFLELTSNTISLISEDGNISSSTTDYIGSSISPRPITVFGYYPGANISLYNGNLQNIYLKHLDGIWNIGFKDTLTYQEVPLSNKWYMHPLEQPQEDSIIYRVALTDESPPFVPACKVSTATKYCFGDGLEFWIRR